MKSFTATTFLAVTATAQNLFLQDKLRPTSDVNSIIDVLEIVTKWDGSDFLRDYKRQAEYIENVTKTIKS